MNVYIFDVVAQTRLARKEYCTTALVFACYEKDAIELMKQHGYITEWDEDCRAMYQLGVEVQPQVILEKE